jgi:hypothetical protein
VRVPLLLWISLSTAQAQDACQQVRDVRAMAVREGLDDSTLRVLEQRACAGQSAISAAPITSADCASLQTMAWLAGMGGAKPEETGAVERARDVACALPTDEARRSWDNGLTMKSTSGSWSYPNGLTARSTGGAWSYPNGLTARSTGGAWSYPNGLTARSVSGRWSRPDGISVASEQDLVRWACDASPNTCREWLAWIGRADGEARAMGVLAMAWEARSR